MRYFFTLTINRVTTEWNNPDLGRSHNSKHTIQESSGVAIMGQNR